MNTTYGVLNNSSLIIDTDKLRENVRTILRSLPAGTKLIPVVKDDAYGMGMVGVARTLSAFPEIGCFAVANVSEGVMLRREGIRQDILIMGSTRVLPMIRISWRMPSRRSITPSETLATAKQPISGKALSVRATPTIPMP